jgi:tRNA pseudouridine38-40 synthase
MLKKYKITIAYDGTNYHGWQIQKNSNTIEAEITKACGELFKNEVKILGASRTDSGVHAIGQVATVEVDSEIPEWKVTGALNAYLPKDIIVQESVLVDFDFHPQYHAIKKTYSYKIYNARHNLPTLSRYTYFYYKGLDIEKMAEAGQHFLGEHDFKGFCTKGGSAKTSVRTIYSLDVYRDGNLIEVRVCGNGFLYNMVRIIVGCLIEVGRGNIKPSEIPEIILSGERRRAGKMVPAHGLTLEHIEY